MQSEIRAFALSIAFVAGCAAHGTKPAGAAPSFEGLLRDSRTFEERGQEDDALRAARQALEEARADPGPSRKKLEDALGAVAQAQIGLHHVKDVIATLQEDVPILVANHGQVSEQVRYASKEIGLGYVALQQFDVGRRWLGDAVAIAEKMPDQAGLVELLTRSASVELSAGDYVKAKTFIERAIPIAERQQRPADLADCLRTQARVFEIGGARDEAEATARRALAIDKGNDGPNSLGVADDDDLLGDILLGEGRRDEALPLFDASLAISDATTDGSHHDRLRIAGNVLRIAGIYATNRDFAHASALFERAIAMHKQLDGDDSLEAALDATLLAHVDMMAGDFDAALQRVESAIQVLERIHAPRKTLRPSLDTEATILVVKNAPGFRARARKLYEDVAAEDHLAGDLADYGSSLQKLGNICMFLADRDCAIGAFRSALQNETSLRAPTGLGLSTAHATLALGLYAFGEFDAAADEFTLAVDAMDTNVWAGDIQHVINYPDYLDTLWRATRAPGTGARSAAATGFMAVQFDQRTRAARALSQMVARAAAGPGQLPDLVRHDQDLESARGALGEAFAEAVSEPDPATRTDKTERIRARIAALDEDERTTRDRVKEASPGYGALTDREATTPERLQGLLGPGELLLTFYFGRQGGFVWALGRDGLCWSHIDLTDVQLRDEVRALRVGLDPDHETRGIERTPAHVPLPSFDRARAYRLYSTLFAGVSGPIHRAKHLLVVPSGALESLPLGVLVTRDPAGAPRTFDSYRDTAWLVRDEAITVLPSVSGLISVRGTTRGAEASKPFVGFGAPSLSEREVQDDGLGVLPDTDVELQRMAAALGAGKADVHVGAGATEETLKALDLSDYRVVAFATHGLQARELARVTEPALVLSAPVAGDHEDGFLTASEVAGLKLNADWVVLSACNSAAGDGSPDAEALSGLTRAFFYAGARAVLASHWSVYSKAAAELTTKTFDELRRDPGSGRAEALRRAMTTVMREPYGSDPAYWGPFSFVGDSDAARGH
ncbi:MAG TPA: CHAT domain-containing tetratricopeptide repeat protein [Polyangiaceae bacterium]|nr:CHAT domain-containing tetratricopeptide repeat protein [Polyangiaceae bacterium]